MKNNIFAVVLSAIILFVWGAVSWAVLPWHNMVANRDYLPYYGWTYGIVSC